MKNRLSRFFSVLRNAFEELFKGETEGEIVAETALLVSSEPVERAVEPRKNVSQPSVSPLGQGLLCPTCASKIPVSMEILLGGMLICPNCLLQLKIDTQQSADTLKALQQLKTGFDKANEKRNKG